MDLEENAKHIIRKYRFIVAVSVLKTKPPDHTITEYIEKLKKNIEEKDMDVDSDATICSDREQIEENSKDTIEQKEENSKDIVDIEDTISPSVLHQHIDSILNEAKASDDCVGEILSPSILEKCVETSHSNFNTQNSKQNNDKNDDAYCFETSDTIKTLCFNSIENFELQNYTVPNDSVSLHYDNLPKTIDNRDKLFKEDLKKIENDFNNAAKKNLTQKQLKNITENEKSTETNYSTNTICSDKTLCVETQVLSQNNYEIKFCKNSQQNRNIYYFNNKMLNQEEMASQNNSDNIIEASQVTMSKTEILTGKIKDLKRPLAISQSKSKIPIKVANNKKPTISRQDNKKPDNINIETNAAQNKIKIISNNAVCKVTKEQEIEKNVYSANNFADSKIVPETNIFSKEIVNKNLQDSTIEKTEKDAINQMTVTNDVNKSQSTNCDINTQTNLTNQPIANVFNETQNAKTLEIDYKDTNSDKTNDNVLKNNMETENLNDDEQMLLEEYHKIISEINFDEPSPFTQMFSQNETYINSFELNDTENEKESEFFDNNYHKEPKKNDELEDNRKTITLTIYEEIHKAKSYINRRVEWKKYKSFSSESGYRSDQKASSDPDETTIFYTGMALYKYLLESGFDENNYRICETVSEVLGELIDHLYSEGSCPQFMIEMLEKCNYILGEIFDKNSEDDYITKEENTYILLFLNTSYTILNDTLEKLAHRLETLYEDIFNNSELYEIRDFDGLQNRCYLFHIIEILLRRYLTLKKNKKNVENDTQNTQTSSKSYVIDVWKKKWDPNYSHREVLTQSQDRPCCVEKYRVILDKIIQNGVHGYSLVSFAALQCYNLLHS